ncbi:MAG: hypothetical protein SCM96_02280 [Acidobacteriota bacterium]|nr:hypothetical protein [Acidobacteriota bacterium]
MKIKETWREELDATFERLERIDKEKRLEGELKEIERGIVSLLFTVRNTVTRKDAAGLLDDVIERLDRLQQKARLGREET